MEKHHHVQKKLLRSGIKEVFYSIDDIDKKVKGKSFKFLKKKY